MTRERETRYIVIYHEHNTEFRSLLRVGSKAELLRLLKSDDLRFASVEAIFDKNDNDVTKDFDEYINS